MDLEARIRAVVPAEWGVSVSRASDGDVRIDLTQDGAAGADLVLPATWSDDDVVERVQRWVEDPKMLEWSELRRT